MVAGNSSAPSGSGRNPKLVRWIEDLVSGSAEEKDANEINELLDLSSDHHDFEVMVAENLGPKVKARVAERQFDATDMTKMTLMHLVVIEGTPQLMKILAMRRTALRDINATNAEGRTPLHLAALTGNLGAVEFLLRQPHLRGAMEDKSDQTAYEIAMELDRHEIMRELLGHIDVKNYLDTRRSDRNVYGGGTNAILVGAALIASITFAGWLQPPLGYRSYYQYPRNATMRGAPPDDFEQYAAISEHVTVKVFWIANSLSFYSAIASILAGAAALVPRASLHELAEVRRLRGALYLACFALSWAVVFVFVAFTAAGFASLPPIMKYKVYMIVTLSIGFIVCLHGFSSARMSDPFIFNKYSFIIDPSFYFSKLSALLERWCECWAPSGYQSYESRKKHRREFYNPKPASGVNHAPQVSQTILRVVDP